MQIDDRLATVLHHRAAGARAARVQFRQLLDLLSGPARDGDPTLTRAAFRRLDALVPMIPVAQRERIVADCSARIRSPYLLAWFAKGEPRVALAALSRASLGDADWSRLIPELPIHARGLLRHRRNLPRTAQSLLDQLGIRDRVLPEPVDDSTLDVAGTSPEENEAGTDALALALDLGSFEQGDYVIAPAPTADASPETPLGGATANLGALVRRIEAFQKAREQRGDGPDAPRLPLGEQVHDHPPDHNRSAHITAFLFTTDESGRIDWAEGVAAPLVVGTLLAVPGLTDTDFSRGFMRQGMIAAAAHELGGAEAIAGAWTIDAAPRFSARSGRFTGYVGRFRRPAPSAANTHAQRAADRVRQLLHELRTPVTAIQGFAEVIQQQTVGPVPHEYRALAAEIAGDAARMLAGFAELERLARLEAGTQDVIEGSTDFATVVRRQVSQLQTVLSPRVSRIEVHCSLSEAIVPLAPDPAELLAWRFLGTLAAATSAGEKLALSLEVAGDTLRLAAQLPASLTQSPDVFVSDVGAVGGALGSGLLGAGFALRLARAEARAAGGDLLREGRGRMILTLPLGEADSASQNSPDKTAVRVDH